MKERSIELTPDNKNLKPDLATNAFWRSMTLVIKLFFQMFTLIVLSRILPVEVFGKLAYAMVFINFMSMAARFGVTPAIIQKPVLNEAFLRAGFTLALIFGLTASAGIYFSASLFSTDGETVGLIQLISLTFICYGIGCVSEGQLIRDFNFRAIFFVELAAFFLGYTCLSIGMAMAGYGVWSLGAAAVATAFIRAILMLVAKKKWILPSWSPDEFRDLLKFGSGVTLSAFMYFFSQNLDYFITGKLLGDEALAYYSRAKHMVSIPTQIINGTAYALLLSAFSRLNSDRSQLKQLYLSSAATVAVPTIAVSVMLILIAPELVVVFFGQQWEHSAIPLQILAFNGFFALYTIGDALFVSQRKLRWQITSQTIFAVSVGLMAFAGTQWGIHGVAIGVLISTGACYAYVSVMSMRIVGGSLLEFIKSQLPAFVLAAALIVTGTATRRVLVGYNIPDWLLLASMIVLTLVVVIGLLFSPLKLFEQHKKLVVEQLRRRIKYFN
ncbi:MAG: lipopolysaccharide biosynthesis protein [Granulosicoccus sp.]|nr:lipopolysaccharide biosynthesis protein [Granulosicoccus sp.]